MNDVTTKAPWRVDPAPRPMIKGPEMTEVEVDTLSNLFKGSHSDQVIAVMQDGGQVILWPMRLHIHNQDCRRA